jgi:hypothetical protein
MAKMNSMVMVMPIRAELDSGHRHQRDQGVPQGMARILITILARMGSFEALSAARGHNTGHNGQRGN